MRVVLVSCFGENRSTIIVVEMIPQYNQSVADRPS
jgi:hypothetical protein